MQKLVTIYVDSTTHPARIEEHLEEYLSTGWRIKDIHGFGGSAEVGFVSGWIVVVLESSG